MLGRVFGLQFTHGHAAPNGGAPLNILSSVGNQVEHVVSLLCSRMDEFATDTFLGALRKSVAAMHEKVFANFINWVKHVGLPARVRTSSVADFHEHKMHLPPGFVSLGSFEAKLLTMMLVVHALRVQATRTDIMIQDLVFDNDGRDTAQGYHA